MMRRAWASALLAAAFLPAPLLAAELGRMTVLSRLGQPLNVEIEILSLQPGEAKTLAPRLATREAHAKAGIRYERALAGVRLSVGRRAGRPVLRVRTSEPLSEPYLQLLIDLRSSTGRTVRPYTVLLDPQGYSLAQAKPQAAQRPEGAQAKPRPAPAKPGARPEPRPEGEPLSRAELFGLPAARGDEAAATSRDELFGLPPSPGGAAPAKPLGADGGMQWRGFVQNYTAYDFRDPSHWSRGVIRTQLGLQGGGRELKWKATVRADLDPVYAGSDFYAPEVRRDQRRDFFIRETYVDIPAGGFELRLGKQNIVWGEMVGLFFADIVSARDQRDFILPDFEIIRIPQWALRAERFGDGYHAEVVWLPAPEVDLIGKPGAEFYPYQLPPPPGFAQQFSDPQRGPRTARNSNFGLRASTVQAGWDLSAFYYRSTDVNPTFYRQVVLAPAPVLVFTPRHDRIWQVGGTLGKDLGPTVLKAEVIYASGRHFSVSRLDEPDGVVPQDTLDYVVGLDFTLGTNTRLNLQYFQRHFGGYDRDLLFDRHEGGVTLLVSTRLGAGWEPELLLIQSTNRSDRLVRTRLGWTPERNWRLTLGVDVFAGPVGGFFGRFNDNDRVYAEVRRDF